MKMSQEIQIVVTPYHGSPAKLEGGCVIAESNRVQPKQMVELRQTIGTRSSEECANEQADKGIAIALAIGIKFGSSIVHALYQLGFNKRHVGMRLKFGSGIEPDQYLWRATGEGFYELN